MFTIVFYYLYGLILPFFIGLALAFASLPLITRIKKGVKNHSLATTIFLLSSTVAILLLLFLLARYINNDFKRLNNSFIILKTENQDKLDNAEKNIREYLEKVYDFNEIENTIKVQADSLSSRLLEDGELQLDTETISSTFQKIFSVFDGDPEEEQEKRSGFGFAFILFTSLFYFVLILYNIDYFVSLRSRYFNQSIESKLQQLINDFNDSFIRYFKLRTRIVLLLSVLYIIAFIILDMPGLILFTFLIIVLSYIPYFQYIVLIPLSIGCLVLSIENDQSFFLYFGIVAGVFVIASILEELVLVPLILEKNIGLNPVIMVLGLSVWSYVLGVPGLLLGIPMTILFILYVKKYVLEPYQQSNLKVKKE